MDRHDEHSGKVEEILSRLLSSYNKFGSHSGNHPNDLLSAEYKVTRSKEFDTRFGLFIYFLWLLTRGGKMGGSWSKHLSIVGTGLVGLTQKTFCPIFLIFCMNNLWAKYDYYN